MYLRQVHNIYERYKQSATKSLAQVLIVWLKSNEIWRLFIVNSLSLNKSINDEKITISNLTFSCLLLSMEDLRTALRKNKDKNSAKCRKIEDLFP